MSNKFTQEQSIAYFYAEYRVFTHDGNITLPARGKSRKLSKLHESYEVANSALITAYNPYSQLTDESANHDNQVRLIADVSGRWDYLPGECVDPKGQWPVEPGILILGIGLDEALLLGRKYSQHAILVARSTGETELYACKPENQSLMIHPLELAMDNSK